MSMHDYPPSSDPGLPGLPESIRLMLASAAGYFYARLELLRLEAGEAATNYLKLAVVVICAVALLVTGLIFLLLAAVYLVAWLCGFHWGWVFFGFSAVALILAASLALFARARFTLASFANTVAEFRKDKEWLSQTKTPRSTSLSVVRTS